jgi:penicillin-binding protein 2
MSFHPNDVARRARMSSLALVLGFLFLIGAFFRTQVIQNHQYVMQSEENRLRPIPLPAPRGIIYDRHGEVIAENLPAYSVSITAPNVDSLRAALNELASTLQLEPYQINAAIRRYRRAPTRPTVVLPVGVTETTLPPLGTVATFWGAPVQVAASPGPSVAGFSTYE